ncbi:MAG: hypothetical protein QNK33_02570, partial [Bacteroidales bacterium]|nr:hypothetical protein [Bacteroidales bacterium]
GLDIGTTSLGLAGISPPEYTEGIDIFSKNSEKRDYVISVRDRCDYTIDRIRTVRTNDFRYIRNFFPDRPYMQPNYRDAWDLTQKMRELAESGTLPDVQQRIWNTERPEEELYFIDNDPYEINNLASDPLYAEKLSELRTILEEWIVESDDKGQYPENIEGLRFMYEIWGSKCVNPEYDILRQEQE